MQRIWFAVLGRIHNHFSEIRHFIFTLVIDIQRVTQEQNKYCPIFINAIPSKNIMAVNLRREIEVCIPQAMKFSYEKYTKPKNLHAIFYYYIIIFSPPRESFRPVRSIEYIRICIANK